MSINWVKERSTIVPQVSSLLIFNAHIFRVIKLFKPSLNSVLRFSFHLIRAHASFPNRYLHCLIRKQWARAFKRRVPSRTYFVLFVCNIEYKKIIVCKAHPLPPTMMINTDPLLYRLIFFLFFACSQFSIQIFHLEVLSFRVHNFPQWI